VYQLHESRYRRVPEKRSREVGVRKVLGAAKGKLIGQFIGEALFMSFLATLFAVIIIYLVLPAFNTLVEKQLTLDIFNPLHFGALLLITILCGLIAGSYPAFIFRHSILFSY
jgi:ABC-type antimicrobial peptide transport system permease subunit